MEDENLDDRTEEASPYRRQEWRKEGRVAQSRDLSGVLVLLATTLGLVVTGPFVFGGLGELFESSLMEFGSLAKRDLTIESLGGIFKYNTLSFLRIVMPLLGFAVVAGVLSSLLQFGFIWTTKPLEPDPEKLDPLQGMKRIFSMNGIVEMVKATIKFIIIGTVAFILLKKWSAQAGQLWELEASGLGAFAISKTLNLSFALGLAILVIAGLDFGYQKFTFERKIRMTTLEAKEERKQTEGNPQIKSRVRAMQRATAMRKLTEAVKKADVVVTNPTHIAIALVYDRENMAAPRIVAKGADYMAERIKKIARENGIPCVENVPLARAMYKSLKLGQFITRDLFNAVAEVLAFVYRLKGKNL